MNWIIRFYCLILILIISSCTTSGTISPIITSNTDPGNLTKASAQSLVFWQLKGKIAVKTSTDSGSAMVNWTQERQHFNLSLLSPLGTPALILTGDPSKVQLSTNDGKQYSADTPEQLLAKIWGWNLPVSHLQYWIRGLAVPHLAANKQYDHLNHLTYLKQDGWEVQFLNYMTVGKMDLPNKLTISSPTLQTKIIIYEWKIK